LEIRGALAGIGTADLFADCPSEGEVLATLPFCTGSFA
jgi:hypothetical protein